MAKLKNVGVGLIALVILLLFWVAAGAFVLVAYPMLDEICASCGWFCEP